MSPTRRLAVAAAILAATAAWAVPAQAVPPDDHTVPDRPRAADTLVAPYIDITRETPSLTEAAQATGHKHFTLAFVLGSASGCEPSWGGTIPLDDARVIGEVDALRALGGDVVIASGGALGPYLENVCGSVDELYDAYTSVLDATGSNHLDVDVEASIPYPTVNAALKRLQDDRGTHVSYTMRVQGADYGMDPYSVQILTDAAAQGVTVTVNPMLMNFGFTGDWGTAMITAAESTLSQMAAIWPDLSEAELASRLGVTPMIGHNDSGMVTTLDDAAALADWAAARQIGFIGFWSIGRDNGDCPQGGVRPDCSGVAQGPYEFTSIFTHPRGTT